jgi:hypothetical protein
VSISLTKISTVQNTYIQNNFKKMEESVYRKWMPLLPAKGIRTITPKQKKMDASTSS